MSADNTLCDRCQIRRHSWFTDDGYLCQVCFEEFIAPIAQPAPYRRRTRVVAESAVVESAVDEHDDVGRRIHHDHDLLRTGHRWALREVCVCPVRDCGWRGRSFAFGVHFSRWHEMLESAPLRQPLAVVQPKHSGDREPQPSDGPDYHADHAAWVERQPRGAS